MEAEANIHTGYCVGVPKTLELMEPVPLLVSQAMSCGVY